MTATQLNLCWTGHTPPSVPMCDIPLAHRGQAQSQAAAHAVAPVAGTLRAAVYESLVWDGPATREEIAQRTGIKLQTVCGRVSELLRMGCIRPAGVRRTLSGVNAAILEVTR